MLLFELTDGFQEIHGIEYSPIPAIKDSLTPGCKVNVSFLFTSCIFLCFEIFHSILMIYML